MIESSQADSEVRNREMRRMERLLLLIFAIWTMMFVISITFNMKMSARKILEMAQLQGETMFNKDQAIRFWVANQGGIYVPVSDRTRPNPALGHIVGRDITTSSGKELTLMNPAYVIRELNEDFAELYGITGHITSKKLLREGNAPDEWELNALNMFENGALEIEEVADLGGEPHLRYMSPMITKKKCLKCHDHQGYQVGDVRGEVAVSIPLRPIQATADEQVRVVLIGHLVFWVVGVGGLLLSWLKIQRDHRTKTKIEAQLRNSELDMERIWNQLPIGIMLTDRENRIRLINRKALEILELEDDSPLGEDSRSIPCVSQGSPAWDSTHHDGKPIRQVSKDLVNGKTIEKALLPTTINGQPMMVEIIDDVTTETAANEEIMATMKELERFNVLAVDREHRMIELKLEVNSLLEELHLPEKYVGAGDLHEKA